VSRNGHFLHLRSWSHHTARLVRLLHHQALGSPARILHCSREWECHGSCLPSRHCRHPIWQRISRSHVQRILQSWPVLWPYDWYTTTNCDVEALVKRQEEVVQKDLLKVKLAGDFCEGRVCRVCWRIEARLIWIKRIDALAFSHSSSRSPQCLWKSGPADAWL